MDSKSYQNTTALEPTATPTFPRTAIQPVQSPPAYFDPNLQSNSILKRNWTFGLFDCFDDLAGLVCAFFCGPCYECYLFDKAGDNCCGCFFAGLIPLRTKIRTERGIDGTLCEDAMAVLFCTICSMVQISNEMQATTPLI